VNTLIIVLEIIAKSIVDRDVNVTNLRDATENARSGAQWRSEWRQHWTLNRNNQRSNAELPCRALANSITLCCFSSLCFM